ncbi:CopD family protein [Vitreimonas flagellata]|uniref:CopD family protein n=1 Tax=Vitreimonas flagellata TaxID=2560861 RepID=UPI0010752148|nr:CopD family protein [Vitreimonas flagellata]
MEADPLAPALFAIKLGLYGSALLAAGLGLHASLNIIAREDRPRALRTAAVAGLTALIFAALRLGLANVQLGGANALLDPATLSWTWPALGPSSTAVVVGAVAMAAGWLLRSSIATAIGAIAFSISFGLTGHTQALESPGLAPWALGAHVLIAAFWFAGPITLWPARSLEEATLAARVTRFSKFAVAAVPALFALGVWLGLLLAGGWTPLLTSLYGQLLIAKLAAANFALALGAYNKSVVTARLQTAPETGQRALRLTLGLDAVLFLIALAAIAAATSLTGPPSP